MICEGPVKRAKLAVLKLRGGMAADVAICCRDVFGLSTHWIDGRSYVCPGEECPACVQCWPARFAGFLAVRVVGPGSRSPYLLELSSSAFDRLVGLMKMEGYESFEGLQLHLSRMKAKSPLRAEPLGASADLAGRIIDDMAVWSAISVLYSLPYPAPGECVGDWESRSSSAARRLIELAMVRASR